MRGDLTTKRVVGDWSREACIWWHDIHRDSVPPRPLTGRQRTDIAIVGGGFTGLWTAVLVKQRSPSTRVTLLEAEDFGHGASGRNGGWLLGSVEGLHRFAGPDGVLPEAVRLQLATILPDFSHALSMMAIDADFATGGAIFAAARYPEQRQRAQDFLTTHRNMGFTEQQMHWLTPEAVNAQVALSPVYGGVFNRDVAVLHPGKLLSGLVTAAQSLGVTLHNQSPVIDYRGGEVKTAAGTLACEQVVLATEAYGGRIRDPARIAVQSGMVATEPLPDSLWTDIGLSARQALCDFTRGSTYLQRTADNRLIVGARGSYRWGGRSRDAFALTEKERTARIQLAAQLFPMLSNVQFPYAWGGSLAVSRQFAPSIQFNPAQRLLSAGGFMGEGVGASFLFAQTAADWLLEQPSSRLDMPWVVNVAERPPRAWEPEPLPMLGFQAMTMMYDAEDWALRQRLPSRVSQPLSRLCDFAERRLGLS